MWCPIVFGAIDASKWTIFHGFNVYAWIPPTVTHKPYDGHGMCSSSCNKDRSFKLSCQVTIALIWSYRHLKVTIFHGFGLYNYLSDCSVQSISSMDMQFNNPMVYYFSSSYVAVMQGLKKLVNLRSFSWWQQGYCLSHYSIHELLKFYLVWSFTYVCKGVLPPLIIAYNSVSRL